MSKENVTMTTDKGHKDNGLVRTDDTPPAEEADNKDNGDGLKASAEEPVSESPDKATPTEDPDKAGLPIDRGWAWVILGAAILNVFIFRGITKPYGVFFVEYQKRFDATASSTGIISTISSLIVSVGSLIILTVVLQKVSVRAVVMTGAVLNSASYLIAAFATDMGVLYFSLGVVGGLGMSMVFYPVLTPINEYFEKHRGLANSVMMSGSSAGSVVFAPILTTLFEEYGYTGAMIIVAAMMLNIAVAGALLRPMEFYKKRRKKRPQLANEDDDELKIKTSLKQEISGNGQNVTQSLSHLDNLDRSESLRSKDKLTEEEELSPFLPGSKSRSLEALRKRTSPETHKSSTGRLAEVIDSISRSMGSLHATSEGVQGALYAPSDQETKDKSDTGTKPPLKVVFMQHLRSFFAKDSLLRDPVCLLNLGMSFVILPAAYLILVYVAPYAKELGITTKEIGLLYTVTGALDWFMKIAAGFVADKKWLRHTTIIGGSCVIIGTTAHLMRFVTTFPGFMVFAVLMGLCCGTYASLFGAVLADYIGMEKFKSALGGAALTQGASLAIFFPIVGLVRDESGSYLPSFHFMGVLAYIGAALAFAIPVVHERRHKPEQEAEAAKT